MQHSGAAAKGGSCRYSVFEEVHLTFSSDLQTVLKAVNICCINIILWQTVPAVDLSLREEVKTTITATAILHQFPRVSTCNRILCFFKESIPRNRRQLLHHFEHFYNVCSVDPLLERSQSKFFKPDFIRQFLEMRKHASKPVLDLLKHLFIFHIVRTAYRAAIFQVWTHHRLIKTS